MIALATFLARILPKLGRWFMFEFRTWHLAAFGAGLGVIVLFLDKILLLLATVGGVIIRVVVWVGGKLLVWLLSQLPDVPETWPQVAWATITGFLGAANRYFPVDVLFDYLGIFAAVYASVAVWKLVKFVRGGG